MKRQSAILKTAQSQIRVLVDALVDQLNVSPHTIRRDSCRVLPTFQPPQTSGLHRARQKPCENAITKS